MSYGDRIGLLSLTMALLSVSGAASQDPSRPDSIEAWHEDAWTEIVNQKGLTISYIYYPEADTENNGIVLRLQNERKVAIRYAFTVLFRAPEADTSTTVRGTLDAGEMATGSSAGLFWIPFDQQGYNIGEIGILGLEVTPVPDLGVSAAEVRVKASWRTREPGRVGKTVRVPTA